MPQHAARRHALGEQLYAPPDLERERLSARDPDSLADPHRLSPTRMRIRHLEDHRIAPVSPGGPIRRAAGHDDPQYQLRLQLEPRLRTRPEW
jgi:hypothetical protein